MTINRCFWLAIYYGIARHLPGSTSLFGKLLHSKSIRYYCCKHIFKSIGTNVNIEKGAWFGRGSDVEIGDKYHDELFSLRHNDGICAFHFGCLLQISAIVVRWRRVYFSPRRLMIAFANSSSVSLCLTTLSL